MYDLLFEPALAVRVGAAQWEGIGVRHINRLCHFDDVQSDSYDVTVRIPPYVEDFDRFEKCNNDCIQRQLRCWCGKNARRRSGAQNGRRCRSHVQVGRPPEASTAESFSTSAVEAIC
jgi:hypothetical protein